MKKNNIISQHILSSAKALFNKYGIKKTSLKEIAETLDKDKSVVHYYFPTKFDLFLKVVENEIEDFLKDLHECFGRTTSEKQKVKVLLQRQLQIPTDYKCIQILLTEDVFGKMDLIKGLREKILGLQLDTLEKVLKKGVKTKEFKTLTNDQIATVSYTMIMCLHNIEPPLPFNPKNIDINVGINTIIDIMISGLASI